MIALAHHGPITGGTPGTTQSRKTLHSAVEEIGFSTALFAEAVSRILVAQIVASAITTAAPETSAASGKPTDTPAKAGGADPGAASQHQPRCAVALQGLKNRVHIKRRGQPIRAPPSHHPPPCRSAGGVVHKGN